MFGRKKRGAKPVPTAQTVARYPSGSLLSELHRYPAQRRAERELYDSLREAVPAIDAAIGKLIRLLGGFRIHSDSAECENLARKFAAEVQVDGSGRGLRCFAERYLDSLLTYGEAVGEMLPDYQGGGIRALYNACLDDVEIGADGSPMNLVICRREPGESVPVKYPELVFVSLLNQQPGTVHGVSLLSGLPFVSSILLRIFNSVKTNWERVGDVRFAVTYNPDGGVFSEENARQIAEEWRKAMRSDTVCDFVSLGDVNIRVIGADNVMPDCEVPLRAILEQITAKLGIPPFLLGFSWSTTERMSEQQADILTSELEYYRSVLEPVLRRIVRTHLLLCGCRDHFWIEWEDINLQDAVEMSTARLNNAQAAKLEREIGWEDENEG